MVTCLMQWDVGHVNYDVAPCEAGQGTLLGLVSRNGLQQSGPCVVTCLMQWDVGHVNHDVAPCKAGQHPLPSLVLGTNQEQQVVIRSGPP